MAANADAARARQAAPTHHANTAAIADATAVCDTVYSPVTLKEAVEKQCYLGVDKLYTSRQTFHLACNARFKIRYEIYMTIQ